MYSHTNDIMYHVVFMYTGAAASAAPGGGGEQYGQLLCAVAFFSGGDLQQSLSSYGVGSYETLKLFRKVC